MPHPLWVLAAGLVCAAAVALTAGWRARVAEQRAFADHAAVVAARLEHSLVGPLSALHSVHELMRAVPEIGAEPFGRFARAQLLRHPSLAALEWAEVVPASARAGFEASRSSFGHRFEIREPGPGGSLVRSPVRTAHAVLLLLEPHLAELVGLDIAFDPVRLHVFELAAKRHDVAASTKLRLVEDPPHVFAIFVIEPWFHGDGSSVPGDASPLAALRGVTVAIYRLVPLVESAALPAGVGSDALALLDEQSSGGEDRVLYASDPAAHDPSPDRLVGRRTIEFAGKRWTVVVSRAAGGEWLAIGWLLAGGLVAVGAAAAAVGARRSARLLERNRALRVLGQYTLIRRIGSGGMGHVYEATHALLRRHAAVKVISRAAASDAELARFEREARITSSLTHPNTVVVFDFGRTRDGDFYYAMEHLNGMNLHELVTSCGPLQVGRVRNLLVQICGAIAEAHDLGVVHRDLKPANVMVCVRGGLADFVKVLDFGLAKNGSAVPKLSRIDLRVGTPAYMAPEAFLAPSSVGPAADIYSIGCMAYFLLAGREPFEAASAGELAAAHLTRRPPPLPRALAIPSEVEELVARCLEKEPEDRFRTARQLAGQLERMALPSWTQLDAAEWWATVERPVLADSGEDAPRHLEVGARVTSTT